MTSFISAITLLVPDYDQGLAFYVGTLGFDLVEDTQLGGDKRWVLVSPPGAKECRRLLTKAANDAQNQAIGNQVGGRVFLFLTTDNFDRDHAAFKEAGVSFLEEPRREPYGTVAVFRDPFGNDWDLIEPASR